MKKIAVVCAHAPHLNTGMLTVDLSVHSFIKSVFGEADVSIYNIEEEFSKDPRGILGYKEFESPQRVLESVDYLFYWGDFLHCKPYVRAVKKRMMEGGFFSEGELDDVIYNRLFLESVDEGLLGKVICFGGALHTNSLTHEVDVRYKRNISRLYSRARLVSCRDPMSASFAAIYSSKSNVLPFGLDAAWFFNDEVLDSIAVDSPVRSGRVGYSFNRTIGDSAEDKKLFMGFCDEVASEFGFEEKVNVAWLRKNHQDPLCGLKEKLELIGGCDVVITDTYHCAINSLRKGVPAICIGVGDARKKNSTLGEKKKEWLYQYLNIPELFCYRSELRRDKSRKSYIANVKKFLDDGGGGFESFKSRLESGKRFVISHVSSAVR